MKKTLNIIKVLILLLLVIFISVMFSVSVINTAFAASGGAKEIVMEVDTNRVLYSNNAFEKAYMASTTKILTAITVIENCNLSDEVIVTAESVGVEGSSIYLEVGEKLTVKELLYGLMLRSGNDCAETLALHCSKSIDAFAELMNNTAQKIGANNSNFTNPHGLHDDNHYTTAYDLALISCYAIKNKDFKEIVSTKSVRISYSTHDYNRYLVNKNKMLKEFEGTTGIKTGYTKRAGRCLVTSCYRNGLELVTVVLNCPPMFERSKTLLQNAFDNYGNYKIIESDCVLGFIDTIDRKAVPVEIKSDIDLPLSKSEKENLKVIYNLPSGINQSFEYGLEVGNVEIFIGNDLLITEKLFTISN